MKTWIIILNWNGLARLPIALGALNQLKGEFEILIADNGSVDGSLEAARQYVKKPIHTLFNNENLGFAEGNNRAIRYATDHGAQFIALINDDLAVQPDWLEHMLKAMEIHPKAAILGGTILFLDKPKIINSTGIAIDFFYRSPDENFNIPFDHLQLTDDQIAAVSGGAMFLRVSSLKEIGLFNPNFFAYFEDVDLCLRAKEYGFQVRRVPNAISHHLYNGTFSEFQDKRTFLLARNHLFVVRTHAGPIYRFIFIPAFLLYRFFKFCYYFLTNKKPTAFAELRGAFEGATAKLGNEKRL